jgi:hypothetical protein
VLISINKDRRISSATVKTLGEKKTTKTIKPSMRCLLKPIETFLDSTHIIRIDNIFKSRGLFHIN